MKMISKFKLFFISTILILTADLEAVNPAPHNPGMAQNIMSIMKDKIAEKNTIQNLIDDNNAKSPADDKSASSIVKKKVTAEISKILSDKNQVPSLMFSDQELDDISRAVDSYDSGQSFLTDNSDTQEAKITNNSRSLIYLGSILYHSPGNWAAWINDKKISSVTNDPNSELYIKSINASEANILWTISASKWKVLVNKRFNEFSPVINKRNQVEVSFTLKPNQTFMLLNNEVIEGKVETKMPENKTSAEDKTSGNKAPDNDKTPTNITAPADNKTSN